MKTSPRSSWFPLESVNQMNSKRRRAGVRPMILQLPPSQPILVKIDTCSVRRLITDIYDTRLNGSVERTNFAPKGVTAMAVETLLHLLHRRAAMAVLGGHLCPLDEVLQVVVPVTQV